MEAPTAILEGEPLEDQVRWLRGWRERLLKTLLITSAVLHLGGTLVFLLAAPNPSFMVVATSGSVGLLHLMALGVAGHVRLRSVLLVLSVLAEAVALGARFGWAPSVVLVLLFDTLFAGLLLGRMGALVISAAALLLLLAGGLAVQAGHTFDPIALDVTRATNWLRVAALFTFLTGVMATSLMYVLRTLAQLHHGAKTMLIRARQEAAQAEAVRTSRVNTEKEVRDTQRLRTLAQLSGGVAHLLNNTFTVVRAGAEQLAQAQSTEEVHAVARGVADSATLAAQTTRELLVFSRRDQPQTEPVLMANQVSELQGTLEEALPENIALNYALEPTPPILAEPLRVRQLILNLVLNGCDAIDGGGTITLSTGTRSVLDPEEVKTCEPLKPGDYAVLTVADSGAGMHRAIAERACEPFFTTKDPARHEGLGLFVVFGLLAQWGGSLTIASTEDQGTRITVYLPLAADAGALGDEAATASAQDSGVSERGRGAAEDRTAQVDAWKVDSLNRVMLTVTLAFGLSFVGSLFLNQADDLLSHVSAVGGLVLMAAAWRLRRLPFSLRLGVLIGLIFVITGFGLLKNGFMAPASMTALAVCTLIASVYAGRLAAGITLLASALILVCGTQGSITPAWLGANVDTAVTKNWFRIATVLPVLIFFAARMVLDLLDTATASLARLEQSLAELLRAREERAAESHSLAAARQMVVRMTRLEAAGRMAGSVAHDLNNALTGVLGWASLLRDDPEPQAEEIRDAAISFNESADLAQALVLQLEPHAPATPGHAQATDVAELVERSLLVLQHLVHVRVTVETKLERGCFAPIAENDLRRILFNLAVNARDAMKGDGTLSLRCHLPPGSDKVVLQVQDSGCGMDEQTRRQAFDAFFTTKESDLGTGLGLHTVAQIVRSSGGNIDVDSEPGRGTCISLRWPLTSAPPVQRAATETARVERTGGERGEGGSKGVILLAEDNRWVRQVMVRGLERAGFQIVSATDGTEARSLLESRDDWDALCTDAIMPGYPSARLISDFRGRFPRRPVILCSGHMPGEVAAIVASGELTFLPKPLAPSRLVEILHQELSAQTVRTLEPCPSQDDVVKQ